MKEAVDLLRQHRASVARLTPNNPDITAIDELISSGEVKLDRRPREVITSADREFRLEIGTLTLRYFLREFINMGIRVGGEAEGMIDKIDFSRTPQVLDLVRVASTDIGLGSDGNLDRAYNRAERIGLVKCPPEVAPYLRLIYSQPIGESLGVAMDPIKDSSLSPRAFVLERDEEGVWLRSDYAYPTTPFWSRSAFIFARAK